jgi:hypothetical protein
MTLLRVDKAAVYTAAIVTGSAIAFFQNKTRSGGKILPSFPYAKLKRGRTRETKALVMKSMAKSSKPDRCSAIF